MNNPQLYWACRRGMLELDVLLGNFLKEAYPGLSASDQALFVALLEESDPQLFSWLLGSEEPTDAFAQMIRMIQHHARTRIRS